MHTAAGYQGIGKNQGIFVPAEEAFAYAMEHMDKLPEQDKKNFVEWWFSGDFLLVEGEDRDA